MMRIIGRRRVSAIAAALACAAFLAWCGCATSTSPHGTPAPGATRTLTSSVVAGHSHTVTLDTTMVKHPPAAGITMQTSIALNHSHTFTMTQAELASVNGGVTEDVTTSIVNNHDHVFTIRKWF